MLEVKPASVAVLVSGRGCNLQAILDAGINVSIVISDRYAAPALDRAHQARVPTAVLEAAAFASANDFEAALGAVLADHKPNLVVLAGFMRILSVAFVGQYAGRIVNIHPSLLPAFPGRATHRRVLEQGLTTHGCTVHWVTTQVDAGPIIRQAQVAVLPADDEHTLAQRVLEAEQCLYPAVIYDILTGRVSA